MTDIWFISDTHFFHSNILKFTDDDGKRIRPEFSSIGEMNEKIIENWNELVKPQDHIYHLGDVTFRYDLPFRELMYRLNGHKRLVVGNHDRLKGTPLCDYFEKVMLWRPWNDEDFVASHIPLHPRQFRMRAFNVHGHIHERSMDDPRYINVCVEQTNYAPVHLDIIKDRIKELREEIKE